jgi:hypothetical protein
MEAAEILERAKAGEETPQGWLVLPLLTRKVATGIAGWVLGMIVGFGLFALIASIVIPHNYEQGVFSGCFTTFLLGMTLFIGVGSLWAMVSDIRRLRRADQYVIVITPDDFVKQEGDKVVHVPLSYVRHVTARGARPPERAPGRDAMGEVPKAGENLAGFVFGRAFSPAGMRLRRKRMRTPTTLAFVDSRTDDEVVIATDNSYGDTFEIAAFLKQYAASVQKIV